MQRLEILNLAYCGKQFDPSDQLDAISLLHSAHILRLIIMINQEQKRLSSEIVVLVTMKGVSY